MGETHKQDDIISIEPDHSSAGRREPLGGPITIRMSGGLRHLCSSDGRPSVPSKTPKRWRRTRALGRPGCMIARAVQSPLDEIGHEKKGGLCAQS